VELIITTKNLTLDDNTRKQIERSFNKIGRHLPQARELRLELFEENTKAAKDRFIARGFLDMLGPILNSECRAATLITAVDELAAVMERQAQDFKNKGNDFDRQSQRFASASYTETKPAPPLLSRDSDVAIDIERVTAVPMTLAEAVARINDSKDDFLLFRNAKGGGYSLLYRQEIGGFKLMEIESV
jgi:putative sigma-54 modulation protein